MRMVLICFIYMSVAASSQDLVHQVRWVGPKAEKRLQCALLCDEVRKEVCCLRYEGSCSDYAYPFDSVRNAEGYLKKEVLELNGVPLARSPYCDELYKNYMEVHGMSLERSDSDQDADSVFACEILSTIAILSGGAVIGIAIDQPAAVIAGSAGLLGGLLVTLRNAAEVLRLRLTSSDDAKKED